MTTDSLFYTCRQVIWVVLLVILTYASQLDASIQQSCPQNIAKHWDLCTSNMDVQFIGDKALISSVDQTGLAFQVQGNTEADARTVMIQFPHENPRQGWHTLCASLLGPDFRFDSGVQEAALPTYHTLAPQRKWIAPIYDHKGHQKIDAQGQPVGGYFEYEASRTTLLTWQVFVDFIQNHTSLPSSAAGGWIQQAVVDKLACRLITEQEKGLADALQDIDQKLASIEQQIQEVQNLSAQEYTFEKLAHVTPDKWLSQAAFPTPNLLASDQKVIFILDYSMSLRDETCMGLSCDAYLRESMKAVFDWYEIHNPSAQLQILLYTNQDSAYIQEGYQSIYNTKQAWQSLRQVQPIEDFDYDVFFINTALALHPDHIYVFSDFEDYYDTLPSAFHPQVFDDSGKELIYKKTKIVETILNPTLKTQKTKLSLRGFGKTNQNRDQFMADLNPKIYLGDVPEKNPYRQIDHLMALETQKLELQQALDELTK